GPIERAPDNPGADIGDALRVNGEWRGEVPKVYHNAAADVVSRNSTAGTARRERFPPVGGPADEPEEVDEIEREGHGRRHDPVRPGPFAIGCTGGEVVEKPAAEAGGGAFHVRANLAATLVNDRHVATTGSSLPSLQPSLTLSPASRPRGVGNILSPGGRSAPPDGLPPPSGTPPPA